MPLFGGVCSSLQECCISKRPSWMELEVLLALHKQAKYYRADEASSAYRGIMGKVETTASRYIDVKKGFDMCESQFTGCL